ncbi:hypothetical protein BS50DRAFT_621501 [Corynespora cassiicola Philippines]|uniref:Uncharacterized protein n=1 Tax=Corynespora cassiicola Philippines TaxID=1448308 RepID=A0A2T2NPZ6_CORCC|nr:hypothetical protein BS50DRAFT_621501 [Corynespora cassiicola Philippines]
MLDEEHADLQNKPGDKDENAYVLGSIGGCNVAVVCLLASRIGNNPAAAVATQMRATFQRIPFGLIVGNGGGVPSAEADVRLGGRGGQLARQGLQRGSAARPWQGDNERF